MTASLSADQVDAFRRDGSLFPIRVADASRTAAWRNEIEALEERCRHDTSLPLPFVDYARSNFHLVSALAARMAHEPPLDACHQGSDPE